MKTTSLFTLLFLGFLSVVGLHAEKIAISTPNAPSPIGTYSQAIKAGNIVYLSGQVGIDPQKNDLVDGGMEAQLNQVFQNLQAVANAAGGSLNDATKLTIYATDLTQFPLINQVMATYFQAPYPARSTVQVVALPKTGALVEIEAVLDISK